MTTLTNNFWWAAMFVGVFCCGLGCTSRVDTGNIPVTRTEAVKFLNFPLPPSATNIFYYEEVGGMQCLTCFVRFDVAPNDLDASVIEIVSSNNVMFNRLLTYERRAVLADDPYVRLAKEANITWWTTGTISNGYNVGEDVSYAVHMWVDKDRNRIYLRQID